MTERQRVDIRIRLADLAAVRWPARPIVGGGDETVPVAVPLPRLAWTPMATVQVPLGTGVADRVMTVTRLQKLYEYAVIPLVLVLFLLAMTFMVMDWTGIVPNGRSIAGILGLIAFALTPLGLVPQVIAVLTKTPRVAGGELRLASVDGAVAREAVALNRSGIIMVHNR